ncbi:MAG: ABC transporter ATP-binding protein [Proteobacteria bacterium]|nr:ABC transporter ATP-binding protein [Pseudomonadota bacterium]MDA1022862.1 ABC transporter ATP-binding protein [Pseudomonadota bacterium]
MIVLKDLTKRFGPLLAVDNISMRVGTGEVLGFLGPNGAGKSTTMRMITGFVEPSAGTATVSGFNVATHPVEVKRRIGYLPEGAPTYGDMTAQSYLSFIAEIRGFDGAEKQRRIDAVAEKVELADVLRQPIDTLSKGYKRRVGLAQAILHDPEILIMDEPTDGLDPNQKHQVRGLIREMAREKAIIISTHILEEVEAVCSRAVIIAHGKLLADGTPEELIARSEDHNAVVLMIDAGMEDAVRKALGSLDTIKSIKKTKGRDGAVCLRIRPKKSALIASDVADIMGKKKIPVREMFIDRGTLDEVFRKITQEARTGATDRLGVGPKSPDREQNKEAKNA